MVDDMI